MIQSLLTQLSKQTEFIQKQSYELQREVSKQTEFIQKQSYELH